MKIIHITPSYKPAYMYGGPTISVAKLCETLVSNNLDVEVLTTKANGKTELIIPAMTIINSVKIHFYKRITKDPSHFSPRLLWDFYKTISKPSLKVVIHIHSWWNLVAITSCLLAKIKNVPVVLSPRGMLTEYSLGRRSSRSKQLFHHLLGRRLIAYCTIHATTKLEKDEILKIGQPKSICVIPNLIYFPITNSPGTYSLQKTNKSNQPFRLLFFSRIDEKKGLELLFNSLVKCHFSWTLTLAGTGDHHYIEKLKQLTDRLKISKYINWIGYVPQEKKYPFLSNHQLLVLFSFNENFANVILESLSVGTPVAISDKVGLADFIEEHRLGWITDLNTDTISQALTNAFENPKICKLIRDNAPASVQKHFNEQYLFEQYKELYNKLS